jgi:hypothetical protein
MHTTARRHDDTTTRRHDDTPWVMFGVACHTSLLAMDVGMCARCRNLVTSSGSKYPAPAPCGTPMACVAVPAAAVPGMP